MTVTRHELAPYVEAAFVNGPGTRDVLLAYAAGGHARPEIIDILRGLPDRSYGSVGELWDEVGFVMIGRS